MTRRLPPSDQVAVRAVVSASIAVYRERLAAIRPGAHPKPVALKPGWFRSRPHAKPERRA